MTVCLVCMFLNCGRGLTELRIKPLTLTVRQLHKPANLMKYNQTFHTRPGRVFRCLTTVFVLGAKFKYWLKYNLSSLQPHSEFYPSSHSWLAVITEGFQWARELIYSRSQGGLKSENIDFQSNPLDNRPRLHPILHHYISLFFVVKQM